MHRLRFLLLLTALVGVASGCTGRREREDALKQDLRMMREAIDRFTFEKDQAPQSLQELVNGHYLEKIPDDPFTGKKDWVPYVSEPLTIGQVHAGIADVHSNSDDVGSDGNPYNTW